MTQCGTGQLTEDSLDQGDAMTPGPSGSSRSAKPSRTRPRPAGQRPHRLGTSARSRNQPAYHHSDTDYAVVIDVRREELTPLPTGIFETRRTATPDTTSNAMSSRAYTGVMDDEVALTLTTDPLLVC
jgi:hypothetical protein